MQVKIGEKIKELRKRDGRKQEDLAKALGVTVQAVSRWESGGCYPDVSLIPGIANYFHVSIDVLFGYDNDREERIREYITKYNRYFIEHPADNVGLSEVISMLRGSLYEFPGEPELRRLLAIALSSQGALEEAKPNPYLEEAARIFEDLSKDNRRVVFSLLTVYCQMGEYEKAEKKAQEQPMLETCSEVLLASIDYGAQGESQAEAKKRKYLGEAILALLHELEFFLNIAVTRNEKLADSKAGLDILSAVGRLYEAIFEGDDYGKYHSDLYMLDLSRARIAAKRKDYDAALNFFDSAYSHYVKYEKDMERMRESGHLEESFHAPLLEETGETDIPIVICNMEYLKSLVDILPKSMKEKIINNPRYAGIWGSKE